MSWPWPMVDVAAVEAISNSTSPTLRLSKDGRSRARHRSSNTVNSSMAKSSRLPKVPVKVEPSVGRRFGPPPRLYLEDRRVELMCETCIA